MPFTDRPGGDLVFDGKTRQFGNPPPPDPPYLTVKHVTLAPSGARSPIGARLLTENGDFARECTPKAAGRQGIFDGATGPGNN